MEQQQIERECLELERQFWQAMKDRDVRVLSDDAAIVAYMVHEELTVDDKPVALDAAESSAWIRRGGKWLCTLHTESIAGDPFGRDRQA